jgi:hypothetical protein
MFFEFLLPQAKSINIPVQDFDDVLLPIAKDKEVTREGIELQLGLDHD